MTATAGTETLQFTGFNMNGTYDRTTEEVTPGVFTTLADTVTINGCFEIYFFGQ